VPEEVRALIRTALLMDLAWWFSRSTKGFTCDPSKVLAMSGTTSPAVRSQRLCAVSGKHYLDRWAAYTTWISMYAQQDDAMAGHFGRIRRPSLLLFGVAPQIANA